MLMKVGRFFIHLMLIIFGIMSAVKGPEAFSKNTVEIFRFLNVFVFSHDNSIRFDQMFLESRCLTEEAGDYTRVILR